MTVLVTGASGTTGRAVVAGLVAAGEPVRAAVRDPRRHPPGSPAGPGPRTEVVRLDLADPTTHGPALAGVDRAYLVRPPTMADVERELFPFLDAVARAGVAHVVLLSVTGAGRVRALPHARLERRLVELGLPTTALRAAWFYQNLVTTSLRDDVRRGELVAPTGSGRTAMVDARDVGDAAVVALRRGRGAAGAPGGDLLTPWTLTGATAPTFAEVAEHLSAALGRPVAHRSPSLARYWRRQRRLGEARSLATVQAVMYTSTRLGLARGLTDDVFRVLGRAPRTLEGFVREHAGVWAQG